MHTNISPENPYGNTGKGFAWECIPIEGEAHLDFGCHDGEFLATLKSKGIRRLVGVDISRDAIEKGHRQFDSLELIHISHTVPLPFPDSTFTSISLLEVLEHVYEQTELLNELHRILKEHGRLIISVPGKHLFSFLDPGNLKFRFPKLHRWYYCRKYSEEEYEYRYAVNPDGLIGDVSARKRWHEHFSRDELTSPLEECGFVVDDIDGSGLFRLPLNWLRRLLPKIRPLLWLLEWLKLVDSKLFKATTMLCVATKIRV